MRYDVLVLGAGLAGLSAARDLARAGADVLVVEARDRVGGRVEQTELPDGRLVQLGGEVVGRAHTAYLGLVEELGLTLTASYVAEPGELTRSTPEGSSTGTDPHWFAAGDAACHEGVTASFVALAQTVDPDDPWSHPDAAKLDELSVGGWLRAAGATPGVVRLWEIEQLSLSSGSIERTSALAALRKNAAVPSLEHYSYEDWEAFRVAEGSATVALRMAASLGPARLRLGAPVAGFDIAASGCTVHLLSGESLQAAAVISALPVDPFRALRVTGVPAARLASLHAQRQAKAAKFVAAYTKPFWRERGANGLSESEHVLGSTWPQNEGVLSALIPPERLGVLLGIPAPARSRELLAEIASLYGDAALDPLATYLRLWGTDPWTLGYVTQWVPGDVMRVGPRHGTHEPPFYVCGSDQWVAGYMEGAVRTGRAAAAACLAISGGNALPPDPLASPGEMPSPQTPLGTLEFPLPDTLPSYPDPSLREYAERARRFVDEHCVPLEVKAERAHGHLPEGDVARVRQAAIAARLNGGRHEVSHGGQGWTAQQYVAVHEQLGRNTNGIWWWIPDGYNVLRNGTPSQIEQYLVPSLRGEAVLSYAVTEEFAGSDPSRIATRAVRDGDSWVLNGEKWFVTSGDVAVAHLVIADTSEGMTIFIVPAGAPGVRTVDDPPFMHSFPHGHPAIRFSDVRLDSSAVIGGVGQGDRLQNEWFTEERLGIAVHCVGAMTRLLEEAVAWAAGREQGGRRIYDYEGVSFPIAESAADLTAARLLVWEVARLMDEGADPKVVHAKASVAKLFASEAAGRCADRVLQVFGGRGYIREFAAERFFRELRVDRIWEGTSEIQKLIIARSLERRGVPQVIG